MEQTSGTGHGRDAGCVHLGDLSDANLKGEANLGRSCLEYPYLKTAAMTGVAPISHDPARRARQLVRQEQYLMQFMGLPRAIRRAIERPAPPAIAWRALIPCPPRVAF